MASQVFYRKWRPQTLAEVAGQKHVTQTLLNALKSGHISHAYLFCGPRGTGKTSTGRILAKAVNCVTTGGKGEPCTTCHLCQAVVEDRALDVIEIDAASNRSIDDVRELREKVNYAPHEARYKVYIIDEFHMLSKDACNALLKTLEEPPPHVIFILATTEVHKVLPTIMSRCQRFDFHRLSQADVAGRLSTIAKAEGINIEPKALQMVAASATGSLRDAENLLEQLTTYYGSEIQLNQVQAMLGITGDWRVKEIAKLIVNGDIPGGIATINSINKDGLDLRQFNRELVEYLRQLLLIKTGAEHTVDLTSEDVTDLKALAAKVQLPRILKAIKLFSRIEPGLDNYSTLPLELALVECLLPPEEPHQASRAEPAAAPPQKAEPVQRVAAPKPAAPRPEPIAKSEPVVKPEPAAVVSPQIQVKPPDKTAAVEKAPVLASELERLKIGWKQTIDEHAQKGNKINKTTIAFLKNAVKPCAVEGDIITLAVKYPMHKDIMEKAENKQVAEQILTAYLGRACRVSCLIEKDSSYIVREAMKRGAEVTGVEEK